jgi:dihydrofolate reductase
MAKLIYAAIASLDGYVEDEEGRFDWSTPDEEVHAFVNDLERPIGTYLYGRRMYETMVFWETASTTRADEPSVFWDYAGIWRAAEKIVYSRTLQTVSSARTRIEREFDRDAVRRLKQSSGADLSVGGAELAGQAMGAGLVDECHLFLCPIVVGGGKRALQDNVRAQLELVDERRFRNGVVHLHYGKRLTEPATRPRQRPALAIARASGWLAAATRSTRNAARRTRFACASGSQGDARSRARNGRPRAADGGSAAPRRQQLRRRRCSSTVPAVRHEASCDRAGVRGLAPAAATAG